MDIHNQTGTLEKPLTTLADQLSETARKSLDETALQISAQAGVPRRIYWWIEDHSVQCVLGAFAMGAFLAVGASVLFRQHD